MGYLRRQLYLFLSLVTSLCVAIGPIQAHASLGNDDQRALAEEAFFYDLRFRTEQFMNANFAKILQIRKCLQATISPKDHRAIDLNFCKNELDIVRNNIKVMYPRVRHYMIVGQLLKPTGKRNLIENFQSTYPDLLEHARVIKYNEGLPTLLKLLQMSIPKNTIRTSFKNPLDSKFDGIGMPFEQPTAIELKRAIEGFKTKSGTVSRYGYGVAQYYIDECTKNGTPVKICQQFKLKYNEKENYTYWEIGSKEAFNYILSPKNSGPGRQRTAPGKYSGNIYQELEAKYYGEVQQNPYVALVSSSKPNDQQLMWAFNQMFQSSARTLQRFKKFQKDIDGGPNALESSMRAMNRPLIITPLPIPIPLPSPISGGDIVEMSGMGYRSKLLGLLDYAPIVGHVLEVPGSKMDLLYGYPFEELAQTLSEENNNYHLKKAGTQLVGLVAINIACWIPVGRVVSLGGRLIRVAVTSSKIQHAFKLSCFSLSAVAVNSYMLYESLHEYAVAYNEIFSGMDEDRYGLESNGHFIREFSTLSDERKAIFWSLIFMPVGTKEIRLALKARIPSLSKNAWQRIERYLARHKQP